MLAKDNEELKAYAYDVEGSEHEVAIARYGNVEQRAHVRGGDARADDMMAELAVARRDVRC